jgi:hypothetical protein
MDSIAYVTRTYSRLVEVATRHSHVSTRPGYAVVTRRTTDVSPYRTIGTASSKPHLEATGPEGGRPSGGVGVGWAGHGAHSSWGPRTRAACGHAAAARGQQRRVAHGGRRGRERRERACGLAHGVGPSCKMERERMTSGHDCNSK